MEITSGSQLRKIVDDMHKVLAQDARSGAYSPPDSTLDIRQYSKLRRTRDHVLGSDLFADPAWDLLLDLYISQQDRRPVSVTSACIAAAVPPTTALRWIAILENRCLIERIPDPADRRRHWLALAAGVSDKIASIFEINSPAGSRSR